MPVEWATPELLIACYFNFIVAIFSIFATCLAILVYFKSPIIRQAYQNLLLLNLLVNGLIFSVTQITFFGQMSIVKNSNILATEWICNWNGFLNLFCCGMEIYTLMCIALERYFAIKKQRPLTRKQIIALIVFGYCKLGIITSLPIWSNALYYTLSSSKLYCAFPFSDRSQITLMAISAIPSSICIGIINYCYLHIYRFYRLAGKRRQSGRNLLDTAFQSQVLNDDSRKKDAEKEYKVFLTTVLILGWTMIGWSPGVLMMIYQVISANLPSIYWDIISCTMLLASICGDSIILLVYDTRWKACLKEIMSKIRNLS